MPMFQFVERLIGSPLGVAYFQKGEKEYKSAIRTLIKMMEKSQYRIWAVSGEFDNADIAGERFAKIIKSKIEVAIAKNKPFEVCLLFSKSIEEEFNTLEEKKIKVIEKIKNDENNKHIIEIFVDDKLNPNTKYLKIYWANKRPEYHFHLCDEGLFLEEKHKPKSARAILAIKKDKNLAYTYQKRFEYMITNMKGVVEYLSPNEFK